MRLRLRLRLRHQILVGQFALTLSLIGAWELATRLGWVGVELLPPFSVAFAELLHLLTTAVFIQDYAATAGRVAVAFVIGAPAALLVGFFIGERRELGRTLNPLIHLALGIPQSVFLPVFIFVFGIGDLEKIVFGITHLFVIMLVNTIAAVHSIKRDHVQALRSFGASPWQIYTRLYLPGMLPLVLTGVRLGMIFDILGVLLAEMYAAQTGLGKAIFTWGEGGDTVRLTAGILAIAISTIVLNELLRVFERRASRFRLEARAA